MGTSIPRFKGSQTFEIAGTVTAKVVLGPLIEKIGPVKTQLILTILPVIGFSLYMLTKDQTTLLLGSFLCGLFMSTVSVVLPVCARDVLGGNLFSKIFPYATMIVMFITAFSQTVFAKTVEITGSYYTMFIWCIVCVILTFVLTNVISRMKKSGRVPGSEKQG